MINYQMIVVGLPPKGKVYQTFYEDIDTLIDDLREVFTTPVAVISIFCLVEPLKKEPVIKSPRKAAVLFKDKIIKKQEER